MEVDQRSFALFHNNYIIIRHFHQTQVSKFYNAGCIRIWRVLKYKFRYLHLSSSISPIVRSGWKITSISISSQLLNFVEYKVCQSCAPWSTWYKWSYKLPLVRKQGLVTYLKLETLVRLIYIDQQGGCGYRPPFPIAMITPRLIEFWFIKLLLPHF